MESLGERLGKLRSKKNLTVSHIARELSVSPSTYREWELGRVIKGEPYMKLASIFNVSLSYLMTGETDDIEFSLNEILKHVKIIRNLL